MDSRQKRAFKRAVDLEVGKRLAELSDAGLPLPDLDPDPTDNSQGDRFAMVRRLGESTPFNVFVGALAFSGKPSFMITWCLLAISWVAGVGQIWSWTSSRVVRVFTSGVLLAVFVAAGFWSLPDEVPGNVGRLRQPAKWPWESRERNLRLEFGDSGVTINCLKNKCSVPLLPEASFERSDDGELMVSAVIRDEDGNVAAEIVRNEWRVSPSPMTYDRNYSRSALEVKGPHGRIVLQVRLLKDRIKLQCELVRSDGDVLRILGKEGGEGAIALRDSADALRRESDEKYRIEPIFKYPSDLNLGVMLE